MEHIDEELQKIIEANIPVIEELVYLGVIKEEGSCRDINIGQSNYAEQLLQPWAIWLSHHLDPWDADIIKRILRTKVDAGYSPEEQRILDYEKIKHICDEKIRQLRFKIRKHKPTTKCSK